MIVTHNQYLAESLHPNYLGVLPRVSEKLTVCQQILHCGALPPCFETKEEIIEHKDVTKGRL